MYVGAFVGFLVADKSGNVWVGLGVAVVTGAAAGVLMALLAVTIGVNQHVAGIGITLALVAVCDFTNRVLDSTGTQVRVPKFKRALVRWCRRHRPVPADLLRAGGPRPVPVVALPHNRGRYAHPRLVGENPEAADVAGISVAATRYLGLVVGGALMAVGGAFLTLALLGSFTIDIVNGRGWVRIVLVIFGRARSGRRWRGRCCSVWPTCCSCSSRSHPSSAPCHANCSSPCRTLWSSPRAVRAAASATRRLPPPVPAGVRGWRDERAER